MDPATLSLLLSGAVAALKHGTEIMALVRQYQAGEVDDAEALRRFAVMQVDYRAARDEWEAAKPVS